LNGGRKVVDISSVDAGCAARGVLKEKGLFPAYGAGFCLDTCPRISYWKVFYVSLEKLPVWGVSCRGIGAFEDVARQEDK
jgi:hypothetical protein